MGLRVAATTTTHFDVPWWLTPSFPVIGEENMGKISPGESFPTGYDTVLVEADGAKHMGIKAPREHEPVLPGETTHVVITAGLWVIGKSIGEAAFAPESVCRVLGKDMDHIIEYGDVMELLTSPFGGRKNTQGIPYTILLNGRGDYSDENTVVIDLETEKNKFIKKRDVHI